MQEQEQKQNDLIHRSNASSQSFFHLWETEWRVLRGAGTQGEEKATRSQLEASWPHRVFWAISTCRQRPSLLHQLSVTGYPREGGIKPPRKPPFSQGMFSRKRQPCALSQKHNGNLHKKSKRKTSASSGQGEAHRNGNIGKCYLIHPCLSQPWSKTQQ